MYPGGTFKQSIKHADLTLELSIANHVAGDVLGGLLTFNLPANQDSVIINQAQLLDDAKIGGNFTLHLFNVEPETPINDDAAFSIDATVALTRVGTIVFDTWVDLGSVSVAIAETSVFAKILKIGGDVRRLFGYLVSDADYLPVAADDLKISLTFSEV